MQFSKTVILGNGIFPNHPIPLEILKNAETIICCDGAADGLIDHGLLPSVIVGDMDSISEINHLKFKDIIFENSNQDTNDQTKAVEWAINNGYSDIVILGTTGKREDHSIGNISLLSDYLKRIKVCAVCDNGIFTPIHKSTEFDSFFGQAVSIFSLSPGSKISSVNLKYQLINRTFNSWWQGTLNESMGNSFSLSFKAGEFLVFQGFEPTAI
jgi:thiamine pyrophosphokinase